MSWIPWMILFLGSWLVTGSFAFGYHSTALVLSDFLCGILLIILGWRLRSTRCPWSPWVGALVGIWLQGAPIFFSTRDAACFVNDTLIGALVVAFLIIIPPLGSKQGGTIPPGWSYNPSSWAQRIPIIFFAGICWFAARILAAYQLGFLEESPLISVGTRLVLISRVSQLFPVSDAGLGSFAYAIEFLLACQGGESRWRTSPWMCTLSGILIVPVSFISVLLIILQPLSVGAWCSLCLFIGFSALITIPLGLDELVATLQYSFRSREKSFWTRFFKGGSCPGAKKDQRSPHHSSSILEILRASCWGVTVPWNLILSAMLGCWLMLSPWLFQIEDHFLRDIDYIMGPLLIMFSIISLAELARSVRWMNAFFGGILLIVSFLHEGDLNHYGIAILAILLSIRRGPVYERSGFIS